MLNRFGASPEILIFRWEYGSNSGSLFFYFFFVQTFYSVSGDC